MDTGTMSQSLEKNPDKADRIQDKKKILASTVIPVEVFIIFMTNTRDKFTVNELISLFFVRTRILLTWDRMSQISNDLVQAGKINKVPGLSKTGRPANYYYFNSLM